MSYANRLKQLSAAWKKTKTAPTGNRLPPGNYQCKITKAFLGEQKTGQGKGSMLFVFECQVISGPLKGRKTVRTNNLDYVGKNPETGKTEAMGIAYFKSDLERLGIPLPKELSTKSLQKVAEAAKDILVEVAVVENDKGYTNTYIRRTLSPQDEADEELDEEEEETEDEEEIEDEDESEEEDEEEDEDEDEEDEEDEEEEEPAPKKSKKAPAKKAAKAKPAPTSKKAAKKQEEEELEEGEDDDEIDWGD